jgi:hypothetical protein
MQHKKLRVIFEIDVQSANGEWGVDDVRRELERLGLIVLSHHVIEGDESLFLARQPLAICAGVSTARRVPFP